MGSDQARAQGGIINLIHPFSQRPVMKKQPLQSLMPQTITILVMFLSDLKTLENSFSMKSMTGTCALVAAAKG